MAELGDDSNMPIQLEPWWIRFIAWLIELILSPTCMCLLFFILFVVLMCIPLCLRK